MKKYSIFLLLTAGLNPFAAADYEEEAQQCFEWFSTLDFPDVKDAQYAEVWTGSYSQSGQNAPVAITTHGFILNHSEAEFVMLGTDLIQRTLTKTKHDTAFYKRTAFEKRSLRAYAIETIELLGNRPQPRRFPSSAEA